MTVPPGTGGTPVVASATGVPANGVVSMSGTVLTYSFSGTYLTPGTAVTLGVGALTNSSSAGSYVAELTANGTSVNGPSLPIDTGLARPLSLGAGTLLLPTWSISRGTTGATGVTYGYAFTTATGATLSSVTMTVPPSTAGTPVLGSASGVPGGGTVSLSGTVLTYSFAPTPVGPATVVGITIGGITNTPTPGSYVAEVTTNGTSPSLPLGTGMAGPLSFSAGLLMGPTWTTSTSAVGPTGVTYGYSSTTASGAVLTAVTMTVPAGTSGTPVLVSAAGVPSNGAVSLTGTTLTYSFAGIFLNPGTAIRLSIGGITNTSSPGSSTAEITTKGTTAGGPSYPIDTGIAGPLTFR